jgi:hypothetical protein
MTTRNDRTRRKARKARKLAEHEAEERAREERALLPPTPINFSRLRQIFANMSFRSHVKGGTKPFKDFVLGPHVVAKNPTELVERTDEAFVDATLGKPEN